MLFIEFYLSFSCSMRTHFISHLSKTTRILFGVVQLDVVNNDLCCNNDVIITVVHVEASCIFETCKLSTRVTWLAV